MTELQMELLRKVKDKVSLKIQTKHVKSLGIYIGKISSVARDKNVDRYIEKNGDNTKLMEEEGFKT